MEHEGLERVHVSGFGSLADVTLEPKRTQALTVELDFVQNGHRTRHAARLGFAAGDRLLYLDESIGIKRVRALR